MVDLLDEHSWPGNIRQLVHVLKIALAMADGDELESFHLPPDFFEEAATENANHNSSNEPLEELIPRLLAENDGNVSRTAQQAGVSRNTVYKYRGEIG